MNDKKQANHKVNSRASKWKVISLSVNEPFQIINFQLRLAKHIKKCKGVRFSIVESPSRFPQKIQQVGLITISFNKRINYPIQYILDFDKNLGHKKNSITLNRTVFSSYGGNQGFYIDTGRFTHKDGAFVPYTVKIYLELETAD